MAAIIVVITVFAVLIILLRIYLRFGVLVYKSNEKMTGKVVIVTGANSGIGFYIAKDLAQCGARVILACRNDARGTAARDQIIAETGNSDVVYKNMDLASLNSVRKFCEDVNKSEVRLDVLVNNAGVFGFGDRYTEDGIIEGMQINHYATFLLTELLLPLLKKAAPSRIVMVNSLLHYIGNVKVDFMNQKGYYTDLFTYGNSKLCNMAYVVELARKLEGTGVVVNAVHPGIIKTHISDNVPKTNIPNILTYIAFCVQCWICYRSAWEGAQSVLYVCVDPTLARVSGKFFVDGAQWTCSWRCFNKITRVNVWRNSEKFVNENVNNGFKTS